MHAVPRHKAVAALASAMLVLALVAALILGLDVRLPARAADALVSLALDAPKPRERRRVQPAPLRRHRAAKQAPSPRNMRNQATQVVAPRLPPLIVPPVPAAIRAGTGAASANGAAARPGPGQGAGGLGNGLGGGGDGDGDGDTPPEQIRGRLAYSDLPPELRETGAHGLVGVRYAVEVDGRVSDCRAIRPSGNPVLDRITCALIERRFRFRPELDRAGRPVRSLIEESHGWSVTADPGDDG